jgi:hypothetical protein
MMRVRATLLLVGLLCGLGWIPGDDGLLPRTGAVVLAQTSCVPRQPIRVQVENSGPDLLRITLSAPTPILQIHFGPARYARLYLPGGPVDNPGNFDYVIKLPTTQFRFFVFRDGGTMHVPLTVVDGCGPWNTFVGGGLAVGRPTTTPTLTPTPTPTPLPGPRHSTHAISSDRATATAALTSTHTRMPRRSSAQIRPTRTVLIRTSATA